MKYNLELSLDLMLSVATIICAAEQGVIFHRYFQMPDPTGSVWNMDTPLPFLSLVIWVLVSITTLFFLIAPECLIFLIPPYKKTEHDSKRVICGLIILGACSASLFGFLLGDVGAFRPLLIASLILFIFLLVQVPKKLKQNS
jgi:hypothetical protein